MPYERLYEIKTIRDSRHDIFRIEGDSMESSDAQVRIYANNEETKDLVAAFNDWLYAMEVAKEGSTPI